MSHYDILIARALNGGGGGGGAVDDVQINGESIVSSGVANIPIANTWDFGVVKVSSSQGIGVDSQSKTLYVSNASENYVKAGANPYFPIVPLRQHVAAFYGLAKAAGADMKDIVSTTVGVYPEAQKSAISDMLNAPVSVSGSTPSITALSGVRYVCGEVSTISITLPASGCVDVVFESGSTPAVLTVTPPSGVTAVKWANGFDPSALEADTVYELNILDGEFGVVASWT